MVDHDLLARQVLDLLVKHGARGKMIEHEVALPDLRQHVIRLDRLAYELRVQVLGVDHGFDAVRLEKLLDRESVVTYGISAGQRC